MEQQTPIMSWDKWENTEPNSFIYQVQRGRHGLNIGLSNGVQVVNKYIYGTHRGRYYLIGGDSGTGKTTITDFMFVLNAWISARQKGKKIKIFYFSFEISRLEKEARWVSYFIYSTTGKCIPSDYILGRIPGVQLSNEDLQLVQQAYTQVKEIMKDIVFLEDGAHPTAIFENMIQNHYEKHGKVNRADVNAEEKKKGKKGRILSYTPNDPDMYTMLVIDHLALLNSEMGLNLKGTIDKMSRYAVILRNMFQCTCVFIQQFSTDMLQVKKDKMQQLDSTKKEGAITPNRLDFGDSKTSFRDCDIALGIVKPSHFGLESYSSISTVRVSLGGLGDFMVVMTIMKNRYGMSNRYLPLYFNPIAGVVEDITFGTLDSFYDKAVQLNEVCESYFPKEV